ncbi:MAG: glycosyltransferase [Lachnospiraceae bacterium]|jgi:glycosyltransferase involved in cell wall biosynthesis|nr:glycosyltransferase [Lachnospiraceae bacterium]
MPRISILVPIYNVEKYLKKCLDSMIQQTFTDIEIICMDDGSTDGSGKILDQYADKDSRIRVIHKENSGYGNTMNQAIALAKGEYIGIVESDDYIAYNMYDQLYQVAEKYKVDFVKSDYFRMWSHEEDGTEELEYRSLTQQQDLYNRVLNPNEELETYYMEKFTWNALYRKRFLLENKIAYNETAGASYQDNGFWFQTFYFARRVLFIKEAFYRYKQDNPNSSVNSNKKVYAMKEEYDFIRSFLLKQKSVNKKLFHICFHYRLDGYLYTLSMLADSYKQELAAIIKQECEFYEQLGEANFDKFPDYKIEIIQQLRKQPEAYVGCQIQENTRIREILKGHQHVIIYGAGNYGKNVYLKINRILEPGVTIEFAVTDLKGKKSYCYSNIVKEISELAEQKNNGVVIVSVKKDTQAQKEMEAMLEKLQFSTVINCSEIL